MSPKDRKINCPATHLAVAQVDIAGPAGTARAAVCEVKRIRTTAARAGQRRLPEEQCIMTVVVVTGASGRIGQSVARHLVEAGHEVRAVDLQRPPHAASWVSRPSVSWTLLDLQSDDAAERLGTTCAGAAALIHLAAVPDDAPFLERLVPVNIIGLHKVLEACRASESLKRVVVASSGKIMYGYGYGDRSTDSMPLQASTTPRPICLYGATKLFAEGACQAFAFADPGVQVIAVRFAWCPRTSSDVSSLEAGGSGAGVAIDEYLSPNDAGRFCLAAATAELPADVSYRVLACCSKVPEGGVVRWDLSDAKSLLGWEPQDTFPDGIAEIVADNESGGYTNVDGLFAHSSEALLSPEQSAS